jgi:SAM-dependent methyltransferase
VRSDPAAWEAHYAAGAPWDTGKPFAPLVAQAPRAVSPVLDAGCGTGENALAFAALGHGVTGIDLAEEAIRRARAKAAERRLVAEFLVKDALTLRDWGRRFATVIDCGLFHVLADEERGPYVDGLRTVLVPGGILLLSCFSDEEPGTDGPRRVSRREIREAFAAGFEVESVERARFEVNPDAPHADVGARTLWFAVLRRG